jgi:putative acetyltransferase
MPDHRYAPYAPAIRPETPTDRAAVREVHVRAFGGSEREAALADALRAAPAGLPPLSLVATIDDDVVGHVLLTASRLDAPRRVVDVFVLSPVGVLPEHQGRGVGTRLIEHALAAADRQRVPLVFLEGPPGYYGSRGFEPAAAAGFRSPSLRIPDAAFQVARLSAYESWMTGTLVYAETFWAQDCVGLRGLPYVELPHRLTEIVSDRARTRAERAGAATEAIREATGARWVGIYSVAEGPTADGMVRNEGWSGPGPPAHPTFPVTQGLTAHALAAASVALSNDVGSDPRYLANQVDSGSELIVPVVDAADQVVGTLDVESDRVGAFDGAGVDEYERLAALLVPLWS